MMDTQYLQARMIEINDAIQSLDQFIGSLNAMSPYYDVFVDDVEVARSYLTDTYLKMHMVVENRPV